MEHDKDKIGREHKLSNALYEVVAYAAIAVDNSKPSSLDIATAQLVARMLADYDVATLEELKERLKK